MLSAVYPFPRSHTCNTSYSWAPPAAHERGWFWVPTRNLVSRDPGIYLIPINIKGETPVPDIPISPHTSFGQGMYLISYPFWVCFCPFWYPWLHALRPLWPYICILSTYGDSYNTSLYISLVYTLQYHTPCQYPIPWSPIRPYAPLLQNVYTCISGYPYGWWNILAPILILI